MSHKHFQGLCQPNKLKWPDTFFPAQKHTQTRSLAIKIRIPAQQKCDTIRFCAQLSYISSLRLLQLSLLTGSSVQIFPASCLSAFSRILPSFSPQCFILPIVLVLLPHSPLLSDKLFVGRNLSQALLSSSQVLPLSLFLCLSVFQRATT